ncbi:methyltransferase domain-containing protein [Nocardioides sp. TRM66260-LWL]|uniref:class I SAM-dependent methyltransferase n=1 Tax=Nocardioides sp. TRM66260-LWL TaxID=2874478 RepID=UPI001CC6DC50|nr:methyltransferase domain-containing protein [Nocardioides sp. TRM66260-LWL]MBZ5733196.1 methyltransferase domain-containing protein [Nocardioides sp. TRM66260-LWL]
MDLDAFRWLLTDDGAQLLARARQVADRPALAQQAELRRHATPERVAAALTQAGLRQRAVAKFGDDAARLWFTSDGLEQATRRRVADHRAARLRAFGAGTLLDLGCGIGGDLMAAARVGVTAAGVDLDPLRVAVAQANLAALGLPGAVVVADAADVDPAPFDVVFVDPARRGARGRTFSPDDWTPPWPLVASLLERDACAKLAPGIPHDLVPDGVEAEWVSDDGEVKEAALWSGRLATCARRATVISGGGLATLTEDDDPGAPVVPLGRYLHEPDGAVIRAGLVTAVAARLDGGLLDEHIAYVTTDSPDATPFSRAYAVQEVLPYREKALRTALRERGIGRLTIKKRGVDVVPEQLRRRLDLRGDAEATIVLTRIAGEGACVLVEPLAR